MNYEPIVAGTQSNSFTGTKASDNASQARKETEPVKDYILLLLWTPDPPFSQDPKSSHDDGSKHSSDDGKKEELLQFKLQKVWTLVDLPNRKRAIGTKWVFRNKKDEKGIVIKNKARLVAQGYTQEGEIDCDKVFAPVARVEAIRLFLAYASFEDFMVYQMDVKSAFLYGRLKKRCMYVNHHDLRIQTFLIEYTRLKMHCMDYIKLLELVKKKKDGIFISQDKYVAKILKKFRFTEVMIASTPMETQKPLFKDEDGEEVDVHMYRSMIGSLMYLTSSRPDIMFVVCVCARYQVNLK
nr:retrotransposon protein, putative, unclassified [Tanacetum cinerariifolium]